MSKINQIFSIFILSVLSFAFSINSFASISLAPDQALPSSNQVFTLGITNTKESAIVKIRLAIPEGVEGVVPNVNRGWNIEVKKDGDKLTEVQWAGGFVPKEQREDFVFAAKISSEEQVVKWKVYETYQDGTEITWDQEPKNASSDTTPYVETTITKNIKNQTVKEVNWMPSNFVILISFVAFVLSIISLTKMSKIKKA
jgi:uncharacterized protein YcnI